MRSPCVPVYTHTTRGAKRTVRHTATRAHTPKTCTRSHTHGFVLHFYVAKRRNSCFESSRNWKRPRHGRMACLQCPWGIFRLVCGRRGRWSWWSIKFESSLIEAPTSCFAILCRMQPLIATGYKKPLDHDDLYEL